MNEENKHFLESDEAAQLRIDQARSLKEQVSRGGLRFEAYLPSSLGLWILEMVEQGVFLDPSEAAFALLGESQELHEHEDLRKEILKRSIEKGMKDAEEGRTYTLEEFKARMEEHLAQETEPAVWKKILCDDELS